MNPDTGLTYGFDPATGTPDPNRLMEEKEIYSGILHGLGGYTSGANLPDMPPCAGRGRRRRRIQTASIAVIDGILA